MERGQDSTWIRRLKAFVISTAGRFVLVILAVVIASAIAISTLLEALKIKDTFDGGVPFPEGTQGLAWTVIVLRSIEMPLLACLLFAVIMRKPKMALLWLLWSPMAALAEAINWIVKLRILLKFMERIREHEERYKADERADLVQPQVQMVYLGIALFLGQMLYALVICGWTLSTISSHEQFRNHAVDLDEERNDRAVANI